MTYANLFTFIGQQLIGLYFTFFGLWNIYHWRPLINRLLALNIPSPILIVMIGIALETTLGLLIMLGLLVKLSALLLIPLCFITVIIFHPFWQKNKGEIRQLHLSLFITHLTISLGALFLLIGLH